MNLHHFCGVQSTNLEAEAPGVHDGDHYLLMKHGFTGTGHEKYCGISHLWSPYVKSILTLIILFKV